MADVEIACPVCLMTAAPALEIPPLVVCGACGATLVQVVSDATVRSATAADTVVLNAHELTQLRRARAAIARPDRRAR